MAISSDTSIEIKIVGNSATITSKDTKSGSTRTETMAPRRLFESISSAFTPFKISSTPILPVTGTNYTAVRFWSTVGASKEMIVVVEGSAGPRTLTARLHREMMGSTLMAHMRRLSKTYPNLVSLGQDTSGARPSEEEDAQETRGYSIMRFTLDLPYLLMLVRLGPGLLGNTAEYRGSEITWSDLPFSSMNQRVYTFSLPNVHNPHGDAVSDICWGSVNFKKREMGINAAASMVPLFYNSEFNADLCGEHWYSHLLPKLLGKKIDEKLLSEAMESLDPDARGHHYFLQAGSITNALRGVIEGE